LSAIVIELSSSSILILIVERVSAVPSKYK
jgi:hypothetical protein